MYWLAITLDSINYLFYKYIVIFLLLGAGLYFTIRTRFVQFTMIGESFRIMFKKKKEEPAEDAKQSKSISPFKAFAISLANCIGVGNLAGVAIGLHIGGPGSLFWMWMTALVGGATSYVEATIAQYYKIHNNSGFFGGAAYYTKEGFKSKFFGGVLAIIIMLVFSGCFSLIQANTIGEAIKTINLNHLVFGAIITFIVGIVVIGGVSRIADVASVVVPFMAIGYLLVALFIIGMNITKIPEVISLIFSSAFGVNQVTGGLVGAAISQGVRRGLLSNEAGLGSASHAAATADVSHPAKQGLVQFIGIFVDTLVVCSCTGFIILFSGVPYLGPESATGITLTQQALCSQIGNIGAPFLTIAVLLFAFSTMIVCIFYGEANLRYFTSNQRSILIFRILAVLLIMLGFVLPLDIIWKLSDFGLAICGIASLSALIILSPKAFELLNDYKRQKREGKDPTLPQWWK